MKTIDLIKDMFFPRTCAICGYDASEKYGMALCDDCGEKYESLKFEKCAHCGKISSLCRCEPTFSPAANVSFVHLIKYESDVSKQLIYFIKHKESTALRDFIASDMAEEAKKYFSGRTAVTYAPRSREAIKRYGFDQAREIAFTVSKKTGAEFCDMFVHTKNKTEQKTLGAAARSENAEKSYVLSDKANVDYDTLIIVDDVITTGSTVGKLVALLREYEIGNIVVLTAAKTPYHVSK
ncbi:MAG: ComF family protein [Clostridiales bacterium]|nr:ComF family protein [Clostridiales bacterium]